MALYRKKPVVIDAICWNGDRASAEALDELLAGSVTSHYEQPLTGSHVLIPTLEGTMRADVGDWIICGVKGELYPCKPDIFEATYDRVREDEASA